LKPILTTEHNTTPSERQNRKCKQDVDSTGRQHHWTGILQTITRIAKLEYVLADVQDNICIKLGRGDSQAHESQTTTPDNSVSRDNTASQLSVLLTCKQISLEASGMAYSKMSMSMNKADIPMLEHCAEKDAEAAGRTETILERFANTFDTHKSSLITSLVLPDIAALLSLTVHDSLMYASNLRSDFVQQNVSCTARCGTYGGAFGGAVHIASHNIQIVIIQEGDNSMDKRYARLRAGASWLSLAIQPRSMRIVLCSISGLQQIVVRRKSGGQQVSKVIDGKVFAAESGMPLGGLADWRGD
jgi:hypothetical protein